MLEELFTIYDNTTFNLKNNLRNAPEYSALFPNREYGSQRWMEISRHSMNRVLTFVETHPIQYRMTSYITVGGMVRWNIYKVREE